MGNYYGPVTAFIVTTVVAVLTQVIKEKLGYEGKQALGLSLVISLVLIGAFHFLWNVGELLNIYDTYLFWIELLKLLFASGVYSILGWLTANGIYSAAKAMRE